MGLSWSSPLACLTRSSESGGGRRSLLQGWSCSELEPLAGLKAVLECFLRGRLASGEPAIVLGTEHDGLLVTVRQKDKVQFLQVCRLVQGSTEAKRYLSYFEVSRLSIVVNKALQALSPSSIWGPEPEQK